MDLTILDQFLKLFMDAVGSVGGTIGDIAGDIMRGIVWVSIAWGGFQIAAGRVSDNSALEFLGWFFRLWLFCWLGANWVGLLQDTLAGMLDLGARAGGLDPGAFSTVSATMRTGFKTLDIIKEHGDALCLGAWSCTMNIWPRLKYELAWYAVFVAFGYMTWQMITAQVQFMFHGLMTLFTLPTATVSSLAWMSERGVGGLVSNAIYLLLLPIIIAIGTQGFALLHLSPALTENEATLSMLLAFGLCYLVHKAKVIGDGVVNGGPSLHGTGLPGMLTRGILAATGIAGLAASGAAAASSVARAGNRMLWGQRGWAAGAGQARRAGAAGTACGNSGGPFGGGGDQGGTQTAGTTGASSGASTSTGAGTGGAASSQGPFGQAWSQFRTAHQGMQQRNADRVGAVANAFARNGVAGLATNGIGAAGRAAFGAARSRFTSGGPQSGAPSSVAAASSGGSSTASTTRSGFHSNAATGVAQKRVAAGATTATSQSAQPEALSYSYQAQWEGEQRAGTSPHGPPPPPLQHPEHLEYMKTVKQYEGFAQPSRYLKT